MKTIKISISDSIFDKIMFFLSNLPKKDVKIEIEEEKKEDKEPLKTISIKTRSFKFDREEAHAR